MKSIAGYSKAVSDVEKAYIEMKKNQTVEKQDDDKMVFLESMDRDYFANKAAQSILKSAGVTITVENGKIYITQTGLTESETGEKKPTKHNIKLSEEQFNAFSHIVGSYLKKKDKEQKRKDGTYKD